MSDYDDLGTVITTDIAHNAFRQQRYMLKRMYWDKIKVLTPEQAFLQRPFNVDVQTWEYLVKSWFHEHSQVHDAGFPSICSSYICM